MDTRGLTLTNGNNCEDCVTLCVDFIVGNNISDVNICLNVQAIVGCSNVVSRNEASSEERDDNDCGGTLTKGNCNDSIIDGTDCFMSCSMNSLNAKSAETRDDCSGILINKQLPFFGRNEGSSDGGGEDGSINTLTDRDSNLAADGCITIISVPGPCCSGGNTSNSHGCCTFDAVGVTSICLRVVRSRLLAVERERLKLTCGAPVSLDTCKEYFSSFPPLIV